MEEPLEKWLESARQGDAEAKEEMLEALMTRLYPLCVKMAGNKYDAEDCLQKSLIRILDNLDNFHGKSSFFTWCYRITINICYDFLRSKSRCKEDLWDDTEREFPVHSTNTKQAAEEIEQAETMKKIRAALLRLPDAYRDTVILFEIDGYSVKEIAVMQEISQGTVKSRLSRGRSLLALELESSGIEIF
ncbi:MAG TPA: RNA polymerase sigma factor [Clostridiaceae bacterium]|nr:RNA polymerase sigma factor [Clostridiaceae bacterium]